MIIILRHNLTVAAILDIATGNAEVREPALRERLAEFSQTMTAGPARLRRVWWAGDEERTGFTDVLPGDPRYEEALVEELRRRSIPALAVPPAVRPLFDLLDTDKFTPDQRRQVIGILRNIPAQEQEAFAHDVLEVASLGAELPV